MDVEKAWRKVKRAEQMMQVADEVLKLRREMDRLAGEQLSAGEPREAGGGCAGRGSWLPSRARRAGSGDGSGGAVDAFIRRTRP
jgi:hypothetical protein